MKHLSVLAVTLSLGAAALAEAPSEDMDAIRTLLDAGRGADALPLARHAVVADAGSAATHDLLGQVLTSIGRPSEAIGELSTASGIEPSNATILVHIGEAQLAIFTQGLDKWRRAHPEERTTRSLTPVISGAMAGGLFRYLPGGGTGWGESDSASSLTHRDIEARDSHYDPRGYYMGALSRPGTAMTAKDRETFQEPVRQSLLAFDRALAIDPVSPSALHGRAYALYVVSDFEAAGPACEKAAAALKTDDSLYQMAAVAYTRTDRTDDAIRMWEKVADLQPARLDPYKRLEDLYKGPDKPRWQARYYAAMCRMVSGNADEALDRLTWITANHPEYEPGWRAYGSACLALRDPQKAVESLRKAVVLEPKDGLAEFELGAALIMAGDSKSAHGHLLTAAQLRPDFAPAWFTLGQIAEKESDPDTAIAMYERALERQPNWPEAHFNLGALLLEKRESAKALQHLERYLALSPKASDAKDVRKVVDQIKAAR
ncbi:MAG TPA: tetratricopeptide repeat protein [Armatimonadota bacterium]|jgi:tetratricopeptide (TPR) repeat protein